MITEIFICCFLFVYLFFGVVFANCFLFWPFRQNGELITHVNCNLLDFFRQKLNYNTKKTLLLLVLQISNVCTACRSEKESVDTVNVTVLLCTEWENKIIRREIYRYELPSDTNCQSRMISNIFSFFFLLIPFRNCQSPLLMYA